MRLSSSMNVENKHADLFYVETSGLRPDVKPWYKCEYLSTTIMSKLIMVMRILDCFIMKI
jgi:hypothetical protein